MTNDSIFSLIPLASFSIAAGGLAVRLFWPEGTAKKHLIVACLVFLLLTSASLWWRQFDEQVRIRKAAGEIMAVMGNETRTYEEILLGLRQPEYRIVNAAIGLLHREQRIGSDTVPIIDKNDDRHRLVRLYFARAF